MRCESLLALCTRIGLQPSANGLILVEVRRQLSSAAGEHLGSVDGPCGGLRYKSKMLVGVEE